MYSYVFYQDSELPMECAGIPEEIFLPLREALLNSFIVEIHYHDSYGDYSVREILPEVLYFNIDQWYIAAYCYLREESRTFRLDRIDSVKATAKKDSSHGIAEEYRNDESFLMGLNENLPSEYKQEAPLIRAIKTNDLKEVKKLLKQGADSDIKSFDGESVLHLACDLSNLKMVKLLIKNGADLSACNRQGQTPREYMDKKSYYEDCWGEDYDIIDYMDEISRDASDQLFNACTAMDLSGIKEILRHDPCINSHKESGETPLTVIAKQYLDKRKKISHTRFNGIVSVLLERTKDFDEVDDNGNSLIGAVLERKNTVFLDKILQTIKETIGDRNAVTLELQKLLANLQTKQQKYTRSHNGRRLKRIDQALENIQNLISPTGTTTDFAMKIACQRGNPEALQKAISNGAKINKIFRNCETAVTILTESFSSGAFGMKKYKTCLEILLSYGAEINWCDLHGNNVLNEAILKENTELVKFALEHGADPNLRSHDKEDISILESALSDQEAYQEIYDNRKNPTLTRIIHLLREYGAVHFFDLYPNG